MLLNARRLENLPGAPEQIVLVIADITDRKRAEEHLREAKEIAEAASKSKDDFLAALSHELRTSLTPVLMMAKALETDPQTSDESREHFAMMRRNIELEVRLIDDLLDLTRISNGKLHFEPAVSDVHDLLAHTEEIIRSQGQGKPVHVFFKLTARNHHVFVDPARFQQVFWNLIKNAVKFTPSEGTVTVRTHNCCSSKISISVEDNGIGIPPSALPLIFNAFEQGELAGQHRYGGLGLGLAISRAIVELHKGEICAESDGVGRGAKFTVVLDTVEAPATPARNSEINLAQPVSLRLLVVDDHEPTLAVLKRLLERAGHNVEVATTVGEAVAKGSVAKFDALISDLGLPDGTGLELITSLRAIHQNLKGVALSGYGMEEDVRNSLSAGFVAHLTKPVDFERLRLALAKLYSERIS